MCELMCVWYTMRVYTCVCVVCPCASSYLARRVQRAFQKAFRRVSPVGSWAGEDAIRTPAIRPHEIAAHASRCVLSGAWLCQHKAVFPGLASVQDLPECRAASGQGLGRVGPVPLARSARSVRS